jgi:hypothetical protein
MSDIAKFLARVVPWPSASVAGFVNVHWPFIGRDGKDHWAGQAFTDQQTATKYVNGMLRNSKDLFLCMSLQRNAQQQKPNAQGKLRRKAVRASANAIFLRAFWLDVDLWKPGDLNDKKYRTTDEALKAFVEWRQKTGLPPVSLIVFTGSGGFHVYWVLHEPITVEAWQPIAEALKAACQQGGFEADHGRTAVPAQVLRIPGTSNHKHNPPRLAVIAHEGPDIALADIETPLLTYKSTHAPGVTFVNPRQMSLKLGSISPAFAGVTLPGRLDAGLDAYVPTIEEVADECPWVDALLQTGGAQRGENEWRESLRVAYYVQDGAEVAHELSDGHATYAEQDTDAKFAAIEHSHGNGRIGWPQCRTIHDIGAGECKYCPHLPKGKSPLNFAIPKAVVAVAAATAIAVSPITSAMPTQPEWLPPSYYHDARRCIFREIEDPKEEGKLLRNEIFPLPLYNFHVYDKAAVGGRHVLDFDCAVTSIIIRRVEAISFTDMIDLRKLGEKLTDYGIPALPHQLQDLRTFMVSFVQKLEQAKGRVTIYRSAPFGWLEVDRKVAGFVYNRKLFNSKDPVPIQPLRSVAGMAYEPTGDLAAWKNVMKLITDQKRPELIVPICASIGTPLLPMTGIDGAVLHLCGPSGSGKSRALQSAQSVWGSPAKISNYDDTVANIDLKLQQLHNLPKVYDDVSLTMDKKLIGLFMRVSMGVGRGKAQRSGQDIAESHDWCTLMISASNLEVHAHINEFETTNVAAMNRVFEYHVGKNKSRFGMLDTGSEAERMYALLKRNYGVAGLEIAKYYGNNHDNLDMVVAKLCQMVHQRGQCGDDDRYYIPIIAVSLAGALVGTKLGLIDVDTDQLEGFLIEQLQEQRRQRKSSSSNLTEQANVEGLISEFVKSCRDRTLISDTVWTLQSRPPTTYKPTWLNQFDFKGQQIDVRVARDDKIVRVSMPALNDWLKKNRHMTVGNLKPAIKMLMPNTRISQFDLGHGFKNLQQPRIWCLEIVDPTFWDFN